MGLKCTKVFRKKLDHEQDKQNEAHGTQSPQATGSTHSKHSMNKKHSAHKKHSTHKKLSTHKKNPGLKKHSAQKQRKKYLLNDEGEHISSMCMRGLVEIRPVLTDEAIEIVLDSWKHIKKDIERVGVVMFMGLLEDERVKGTFVAFRDQTAEELLASTELRSHVLRVMGAVDKVVARLNEPVNMTAYLHNLGQKHVGYNARPEYLDLVGPQFSNAIQPAMGDNWTPEVEQAWADLFRYITHIMKETMIM